MLPTYIPGLDSLPEATAPSVEYAAALESIAPGICALASQQQRAGQQWEDALTDALIFVRVTDAQRQLLIVQAQRSKSGLQPLLNAAQYLGGA